MTNFQLQVWGNVLVGLVVIFIAAWCIIGLTEYTRNLERMKPVGATIQIDGQNYILKWVKI